jgi:hypothetical protein
LQQRGFEDTAPATGDERQRVHLKGADVAARVKFGSAPATVDEARALHAMLVATGRSNGFFFSVAGFTDETRTWCEESGILLFELHLEPEALDTAARRFVHFGAGQHRLVAQLRPGDRVQADDGGYRTVADVRTMKNGKVVTFVVRFDDGGEVELEMGTTVPLHTG